MENNLIDTLPRIMKPAAKFIRHQERPAGLSTSRYVQDVCTCLLPKAILSRSMVELSENVFIELFEESLIYFVPSVLGQGIARKIFSKVLPENLKKEVAIRGVELLEKSKNGTSVDKRIIPVKAAISLAALAIPLTEYCLNYIKNLMTLKIFKKSDFKNIVSLENNVEKKEEQEKVEKSAKKHIKGAAITYAGFLILASVLALFGHKSKALQQVAQTIVAPGSKLFEKSPKLKNFFNKYLNIDFNSQNGKLVLSKGQLTTCVLVGGAGYFGAAKDRGKENFKETATRFPIVGLYVITGSELVEKGFRKLLNKLGKCKNLIGKDLSVPKFDELEDLAKRIAQQNKSSVRDEFKTLAKQKILISGLPYVFSIGVMGFFVSGLMNYFTKKRYENSQNKNSSL